MVVKQENATSSTMIFRRKKAKKELVLKPEGTD